MTRPARELNTATPREHTKVSFRAATASGWETACQKAPDPP